MEKNVTTIDKNTLILIKNGDLPAFNKMMLFYQKAIFNHLYRLTGSKDEAADLTQDTFFKIYLKSEQIDEQQNFKAWLYKIATNVAYDYFKKKKRKNEIALPEKNIDETIDLNLPYYRIDNTDKIDLEAALSKIKPKSQTVLTLHYQQGFGYEEIAEIMKIPLGTVKTLIYRAKIELAEELKIWTK